MTVASGIQNTSLVVSDLKPNSFYSFIVRANNSLGIGPPSSPSLTEKTKGRNLLIWEIVLMLGWQWISDLSACLCVESRVFCSLFVECIINFFLLNFVGT